MSIVGIIIIIGIVFFMMVKLYKKTKKPIIPNPTPSPTKIYPTNTPLPTSTCKPNHFINCGCGGQPGTRCGCCPAFYIPDLISGQCKCS